MEVAVTACECEEHGESPACSRSPQRGESEELMSWISCCGRSPGINALVVDPTPLCVWSGCDTHHTRLLMLITFPLYLVIEVLSLLGTVYSGRGKVRRLISHIGENASKAYISTYRLALKFEN